MNRKHQGQAGKQSQSQQWRGDAQDSLRFDQTRDSNRRFRPSQNLNSNYGNTNYNDDYGTHTDHSSYSVDAMDHRRPQYSGDWNESRNSSQEWDSRSFENSEMPSQERSRNMHGMDSQRNFYGNDYNRSSRFADSSRSPSFEDERYARGPQRMSTPTRSWGHQEDSMGQPWSGPSSFGSADTNYGGSETYGAGQYHGSSSYGESSSRGFFGKGPKGYKRTDDRIKEDVCECLSRSPRVDASDIEVSVEEGCVTLSGTVDSKAIKRAAEMEIENLSGVDDVRNEIKVRRSSEWGDSSSQSGMNASSKSAKTTKTSGTSSL